MTLSDISIRRPVLAWMLMFGLIVFGAISLGRLGISMMPDVEFPVLEARLAWEGASAEILEAELVDPIEQKLISVEGIKEIRSTVRPGQATVALEFHLSRNIDAAVQEVQSALTQVRMPLGVDMPVLRKNTTEGDPIIWLGLTGPQSLRELITYVDEYLGDQFQVVPGVGEVMIGGYSDRNLRIWLDVDKLAKYELTPLDVRQAIALQHIEMAAGYMENERRELNIRTMGEGLTPEEIGAIAITQRGGEAIQDAKIRIRDVARVEDGLNDIRRFARLNGVPGISLGFKKQRGANEVEVGRLVGAKVQELKKSLPEGMNLEVNVDNTRFVEMAVNQTKEELLIAALLTAFVCYLFLGTWTPSLNVILSIPTSIVGTFIVIYFMGFTLNTFTLLGLALAIGIVVDDAIMVLENIVRHFRMGKDRVTASLEGTRQVNFAAVAATVAVIAIFLPVAFMSGVIGRFFYQFGVTITAAVALSLLEAITLTPMRCSQFLSRGEKPGFMERHSQAAFDSLALAYGRVLTFSLRFRWVVLGIAVAVFVLSLYTARGLRQEFVPPQDQSFIRIALRTPVGSSLAFTDSKARQVEDYLGKRPEVLRYFASVGMGGTSDQAFLSVTLVEKGKRKLSQSSLIKEFRKDLASMKDVKLSFQDMSARGLTPRRSQPVEFNLRGSSYDMLESKSREIVKKLEQTGLVVDADTTYRAGMPELRVWPDRDAAALRGVPMSAIAETINIAVGGVREGKFTRDGRRYDVRLKVSPEQRLSEDDIKRLQVRTMRGELVKLADVVRCETVKTVQTITRVNRARAISVSANLAPGASQRAALDAAERIGREELPPGYSFHLEGGAQTFQESFGSLWFVLVLGIVVAYMVLASQFNSFVHPLTVLLALPFSVSGAIWALSLSQQSLNLYSGIGVILLMGIVKKNSILLVEFANRMREESGLGVRDAILKASPIRLRPILMTSIATLAAALPLAVGIGAGAEMRRPMALAVIGGVTISTMFTLFVVPCAYMVMSKFERHREESRRIAGD